MAGWYSAGTVSVTNGSDTVTGSGTQFVSNAVQPGMAFALQGASAIYQITEVVSATQIKIAPDYQGSNQSGQDYFIVPVKGPELLAAKALSEAVATFGDKIDGPLAGRFGSGSVGTPGIAFADQVNTGLFRPATSVLAFATNGNERARITNSGMEVMGTQVYRRGNIIGTVSQSSGNPTGAIIQRGSGPNGRFVRFADGTQICWREADVSYNTSDNQFFSFPANFSADPVGFGGLASSLAENMEDDLARRTFIFPPNDNGWRARNRAGSNKDNSARYFFFAIGRWF